MPLRVEGIVQAYGTTRVLDGFDLALEAGQIGCLLGASGCGKTTVLRCIAGFEPLQAGRISVGGVVQSGDGVQRPPEQRGIGMVFQSFALFGHLTVAANVAFGLRKLAAVERDNRVAQMLDLTGLTAQAQRHPHELSGGQQQRVALARALAPQPQLLLLDEPFSSLDQDLRARLGGEVRDILKSVGTTALMVTHHQDEAFAIADVVGVMDNGRILQWDTPRGLYERPRAALVARFIGDGTLLAARVLDDLRVATPLGEMPIESADDVAPGDSVQVLVRPDQVTFDAHGGVRATVKRKVYRGGHTLYTLQLDDGSSLLCRADSTRDYALGECCTVRCGANRLLAFAGPGD